MPAPKLQSIEAAREQIVDMLSAFGEDGSPGFSGAAFDQETARLLECERDQDGKKGRIVVEMQVKEKMANQLANMHGGCAATLLDNVTSLVIYLHTSGVFGDPWSMLGVSQSIQVLYTSPAPVGEYLDIECSTIVIGKNIAVIQCDMWLKDGKGGKRIRRTCSGTHTKVDNSAQAKM